VIVARMGTGDRLKESARDSYRRSPREQEAKNGNANDLTAAQSQTATLPPEIPARDVHSL